MDLNYRYLQKTLSYDSSAIPRPLYNSNIRKGKYRPATTTTPAAAAPSRSGYPP